MKWLVIILSAFSLGAQANAGFSDSEPDEFLISQADEASKKKKFRSFFEEEDEEEFRELSAEKKTLEEFSTFQTDSNTLAQLDKYRSGRFTNYLSGNSIEVGIEYPLNFGIHFKSRMNGEFYFRAGSGFVTEFFLGSFSKLAPNFGYISEYEAMLIADVFTNSLYTDFRLGWAPYYEKHAGGPYIEIGFLGMFFGRGETSGFTLERAMNVGGGDLTVEAYSVKSNIYNASFHVGYQIPIEKHINIHFEAGVIKVIDLTLNPKSSPNIEVLPEKYHEDFKNFMIEKGWVFPTFSVWFAFGF